MMNPKAEPPPPPGMPAMTTGQNSSGGGQNAQPEPGDPQIPTVPVASNPPASNPATPTDPQAGSGSFSGGCSTVTGSANLNGLVVMLMGLAIVSIVRRKRA